MVYYFSYSLLSFLLLFQQSLFILIAVPALLSKWISFAETKVKMTEDYKKNNIPFQKMATIWQRKHVDEERADLFDIAMGAYDGAELCELVGIFLSEEISEISNEGDIELYRDDG